jgi:hypothetical protein
MATITSTQTGNWHDTSTWAGGSIPAADDLVVIAHGHRVTVSTNIQSTRTGDVTIDGNLHFANGGKMHLHGRMTVNNTSNNNNTAGEFVEGTSSSGSLLSMVAGSEIKISGNNSQQHGIQIHSRAWCGVDIDGGEPTLKTELNGNHAQRSFALTVDSAANFAAKDLISVYKREEDYRLKNDECFYVHDVDTGNNKIYFRHFVSPLATDTGYPKIQAVSGNTITLNDSSVFRVNYQIIFGTGNNRNVRLITAINNDTNVVTVGADLVTSTSDVDNDPSLIGEDVFVTGTEKYHLNDSHVRRLSSTITNLVGAIDDLPVFATQAEAEAWGASNSISGSHTHTYNNRTVYMAGTTHADIQASGYSGGRGAGIRDVKVANAADFSVGDKIYIEACGDASYQYVSGSSTNAWRHNLVYTISAINGLTLTVDRDIMYDAEPPGLITKMSRGVVIKACDTSGNDIAIGDQDTARVFFNVRYWTSSGWNQAPTRRVKIKYVEFSGLGYNTGDSTNFRAGVTIAGYNGRFDTKVTGSAADNTTIHNTNTVSQTGENYLDGCSFTSYNLYSNSTRDGDSYGGICIRHPYGMVNRNHVVVGAGRGMWHWSTQYNIKSHGHIVAVCNYVCLEIGSAYNDATEFSYMYLRMAEDYGNLIYNQRHGTSNLIAHIDVQYQNSYAFYSAYAAETIVRNYFANKYRYLYPGVDGTDANWVWLNSRVMPNAWDASAYIYNPEITYIPYYDRDHIRHYGTIAHDIRRGSPASKGRISIIEHGFREDESVMFFSNLTRLVRHGSNNVVDWIVSPNNRPTADARVFVPANTVVKLRSVIKINQRDYDDQTNTVSSSACPFLNARAKHFSGLSGRHSAGVVTDSTLRTFDVNFTLHEATSQAGLLNSTQARDSLYNGFIEYVQHTPAAQGAWETKELTVAAQYRGYELIYGYNISNHDITQLGFKALPIQIIFEGGSVDNEVFKTGVPSKKGSRSSFDSNKKRISGRI